MIQPVINSFGDTMVTGNNKAAQSIRFTRGIERAIPSDDHHGKYSLHGWQTNRLSLL